MNQSAEEPKSLLRRLLRRPEDAPQASEPAAALEPRATSADASPVRPPLPERDVQPAQPILPNVHSAKAAPAAHSVGDLEERLHAELALEKLRQKTARVAAEFASGNINRAQFLALYAHYNEKRLIIERLLERNPDTQAWRNVARSGQTTFLRQHYASRVRSFAIYFHDSSQPLIVQGQPLLPEEVTLKILTAIRLARRAQPNLSAQRKQIDENYWAVFIPAEFTTAIVMFWFEPSTRQMFLVRDLHRDFERANRALLLRNVRSAEHYVFPHRALFEDAS